MDAKFALKGYDKDNDIYETLLEMANLKILANLARAVILEHLHEEEYICKETNEPFDWFVIMDQNENILITYSAEYPKGDSANNMKQREQKDAMASKFDELKTALRNDGIDAVETFIGRDTLEKAFNAAWDKAPWEELKALYERYGIDLL